MRVELWGEFYKKKRRKLRRGCQRENKLSRKVQELEVGGPGKGGTTGEEERSREQRKLREFDAPFLSVNGTVIVKAAEAVASLVAG